MMLLDILKFKEITLFLLFTLFILFGIAEMKEITERLYRIKRRTGLCNKPSIFFATG